MDGARRPNKACEICRGRKLRCDALKPKCSRCRQTDAICVYKEKKYKRAAVVPKKAVSLTALDERMAHLESLLMTVVNKLEPETLKRRPPSPEDDPEVSNFISMEEGGNEGGETGPEEDRALSNEDSPVVKYFGTQSSFSLLSPRGIKWLEKFCDDPGLFNRFQYFHQKTTAGFLMNNQTWLNPIEKSQLWPIPPRHVTEPLVEAVIADWQLWSFSYLVNKYGSSSNGTTSLFPQALYRRRDSRTLIFSSSMPYSLSLATSPWIQDRLQTRRLWQNCEICRRIILLMPSIITIELQQSAREYERYRDFS